MPFNSLAEFLEELDKHGQLARVTVEVDLDQEIAEITRRVARAAGPALLFERVRGQSMAVVTNLLGTQARICLALGIDSLDALPTRAEALVREHTPQNWFERLKMTGSETGADKFRARLGKAGACQQVARLGRDIDLQALPLVKQWHGEANGSITAGLLIAQSVDGSKRNATPCTLAAIDATRLSLTADADSPFARRWTEHRAAGQKLAAAVVLGGDASLRVTAQLDFPESIDYFHLVGLLRGLPLELVKCRTHDLEVPATADLVLEGFFDSDDATNPSRDAAPQVMQVTAVTQRSHPIFPVQIDCGKHGDRGALGLLRERMLLDSLRAVVPDLFDLHLPMIGGASNIAIVALQKQYPFHARQIASAVWGFGPLRFTQFLVLVDHDVDVRAGSTVIDALVLQADAAKDLFFYDGPGDAENELSQRVGVDATRKITGEIGVAQPSRQVNQQAIELVAARWAEYKIGN